MINWNVRFKNKQFWLSLIPAILLLLQVVAATVGFTLELGELGDNLLAIINAIFSILVILGIVVDPTTKGIVDSERAQQYQKPSGE